MATIYRALVTAALLLCAYTVYTGTGAGTDTEALSWHLSVGLITSLLGVAVHSIAFAYFLGTGFWVKAFVRASRAAGNWEVQHALWMQARGYKLLYAAAALPAATAISGALTETARLAGGWHAAFVFASVLGHLAALVQEPAMMRDNSALMDKLAEEHRVPRPVTPEMEELIAHEEAEALPPLFQLSRVLMFVGFNLVVIWAYLRFGTEGWREVPFAPFGIGFGLALFLGLGLNARHDPNHPASGPAAWGRAAAVAVPVLAVVLWLGL